MNPDSRRRATRIVKKDAFGIYYMPRRVFEERVNKLKRISEDELKMLKRKKKLMEFLGIPSGTARGTSRSDAARVYETAAGKGEILGTYIGDGLKLIKAGKIDELRKRRRNFMVVIKILDVAGIANRETGRIDLHAIDECLKRNRIVHKG